MKTQVSAIALLLWCAAACFACGSEPDTSGAGGDTASGSGGSTQASSSAGGAGQSSSSSMASTGGTGGTGGAGGGGACDGQGSACEMCLETTCCAQYTACMPDAECSACMMCLQTMMNPQDCLMPGSGCNLMDPETVAFVMGCMACMTSCP